LRLSAAIGFLTATLSFAIGAIVIIRRVLDSGGVPGWTSLIVLIAFLNGVIILMLSMLGEYVVRVLNQVTETEPFHVIEEVGGDEP
jgi:hypothetical protein